MSHSRRIAALEKRVGMELSSDGGEGRNFRECEVTPEMVKAGEDALLKAGVPMNWQPDKMAKQVYLAMVKRTPVEVVG